jgi:hypothetical protein
MADDLSDSAKVLWLWGQEGRHSLRRQECQYLVRLLPYQASNTDGIGAQDSFESVISY